MTYAAEHVEDWTEISLISDAEEGKHILEDDSSLDEWDIMLDMANLHLKDTSDALTDFSANLGTGSPSLGELSRQVKEFGDFKKGTELFFALRSQLSDEIVRLFQEVGSGAKEVMSLNGSMLPEDLRKKFHSCLFRFSFYKKERRIISSKLDDIFANGTSQSETMVPATPDGEIPAEHLDSLLADWEGGWGLLKEDIILGTQTKEALEQCQEIIKIAGEYSKAV